MTVLEIYNYLDSIAPFATAEDWDNAGLLTGDPDSQVTGILTVLDATETVLEQADKQGFNLVVSHHPILFDPVRSFVKGSAAYEAARKGISVICAHTNLDKADWGVNQVLAETLGLIDLGPLMPGQPGRVGTLPTPMTPAEFGEQIEKALGLRPRCNPNGQGTIRTVGLCGGKGAYLLFAAIAERKLDCQAFVSGDVKQSEYLDAGRAGVTLYDAGHYATEAPVIPVLTRRLSEAFPTLRIAIGQGYKGEILG